MIEHYWGIDLGGTKIEAVVIDRSMKPLYRRRVATEASGGYSHILQRIRQLIEMISLESGIMYSGLTLKMLNDLEKSLTKASNLLTSGDVHNAFQLFKELFEDYPSDERVFAGLTKSMCVKGDSGAALKLVDEFLKKHPKSQTYAELYFIKGFAFEVRANWQQAVA